LKLGAGVPLFHCAGGFDHGNTPWIRARLR
jgi:hypothetical protein